MATPFVARNLRHGTLKINDGTTPTALTITIPCMEGDLRFRVREESRAILNRGVLQGMTLGPEEPMEVSFSIKFNEYQGETTGATISVVDALKGQGLAAAWVSTLACGPHSVDLEFTIAAPCTDVESETLTFADFHADEIEFNEGEDTDTINVTGKCLALQPTSDR